MADARVALAPLLAPLSSISCPAWVVGGGLRDALLGLPVADLDLAVQGDAGVAARELARATGAGRFRLSAAFGAWRVQGGRLGAPVDLTPLQGAGLRDDLGRRDLTVNALALSVGGGGGIVDPHGGVTDLQAGRLRLVSPDALSRDAVRILRVARLARQLGFAIDPVVREAARRAAVLVASAPPERLMEELRRIVRLPRAWRGVALLDELGALGALVPELEDGRALEQSAYHHKDVLAHTLEVVQHASELSEDPEPVFRSLAPRVRERLARPLADDLTRAHALVLGALLHDMAKPATRAVTPEGRITFMGHDRLGEEQARAWCRRMRTSTRLGEHLALLVRHHLTLGFLVHRTPLSLRQIDRYLRATAPAELDMIVLSVSDRLATAGPRTRPSAIQRHLALGREMLAEQLRLEEHGPIRPLVSGAELAEALGRPPGPWLAQLLESLRVEQLVGSVQNRAESVKFADSWMRRHTT